MRDNLGMTPERQMLRHTLATVAYRGAKALRGAPADFANFKAAADTRTPVEILAHIGDLYDWALSIAKGATVWNTATPVRWDDEIARFHAALASFDAYLASDAPLGTTCEKLFQGPVADSLTHIGQLTILRRMHGAPIRGESYYRAVIETGRVGSDQAAPKAEF